MAESRAVAMVSPNPQGSTPLPPVEPRRRRWHLTLLVLPFIALLYVPFYGSASPHLFGVPFFVWYQFAWVVVGVAITGVVYAIDHAGGTDR